MLRARYTVAFVSSVSSGAASSRCLLGLRKRLSLLSSLLGWTAATACSPERGAPACLLDGLQSVFNAAARLICNRRKYDHITRSSVMFSTGCRYHSASSTSSAYSSSYHFTEL